MTRERCWDGWMICSDECWMDQDAMRLLVHWLLDTDTYLIMDEK
jgi:hypothetical protein